MPSKILVVDDEANILNLAKMILERGGYQVSVSSNGEEALQKAEAEMPDLVLLDIVMPGKSGLEVCKILKSQTRTRHIPLVMFTALGRDVDRKLAVEAGADGHFMKPFTSEQLLTEVKKYIELARKEKFSKQLGLGQNSLKGKKILFEFDPTTPYERLVRDFALECAVQGEAVVVITPSGSAVQQALKGDEGVEIVGLTPELMLSSITNKHADKPLDLVYDSLTDLALSVDSQTAYKFARKALELIAEPRITALFLLNSSAHEQRDIYSLKGLFSNQLVYGKQGITNVRVQ